MDSWWEYKKRDDDHLRHVLALKDENLELNRISKNLEKHVHSVEKREIETSCLYQKHIEKVNQLSVEKETLASHVQQLQFDLAQLNEKSEIQKQKLKEKYEAELAA